MSVKIRAGAIGVDEFTGHHGFRVKDSGATGRSGELDATDKVSHKGKPVDWDDPDFVKARADYSVKRSKLSALAAELSGYDDAYAGGAHTTPTEAQLGKVARGAAALQAPNMSPRLRSNSMVVSAGANGLIAQHHKMLAGKIGPGMKSFRAAKKSTEQDPSNPRAWESYGLALLSIHHEFFRSAAESQTKISLAHEVPKAIEGLQAWPNDLETQAALYLLLHESSTSSYLTDPWESEPEFDEIAMAAKFKSAKIATGERLKVLAQQAPKRAARTKQLLTEFVEQGDLEKHWPW